MPRLHGFSAVIAILAGPILAGCGAPSGQASSGNAAHDNVAGTKAQAIPSTAPYITGIVTMVTAEMLLVEENPAQDHGDAKVNLRLNGSTRILRRSGAGARPSDLRMGQSLSAWVAGPVMESYPVQAVAAVIIIEP